MILDVNLRFFFHFSSFGSLEQQGHRPANDGHSAVSRSILDSSLGKRVDPMLRAENLQKQRVGCVLLCRQNEVSAAYSVCLTECYLSTGNFLTQTCLFCCSLKFIKDYCLSLIVREENFTDIVMSDDFVLLDKPLMVEIMRKRVYPGRVNDIRVSKLSGKLFVAYFGTTKWPIGFDWLRLVLNDHVSRR